MRNRVLRCRNILLRLQHATPIDHCTPSLLLSQLFAVLITASLYAYNDILTHRSQTAQSSSAVPHPTSPAHTPAGTAISSAPSSTAKPRSRAAGQRVIIPANTHAPMANSGNPLRVAAALSRLHSQHVVDSMVSDIFPLACVCVN